MEMSIGDIVQPALDERLKVLGQGKATLVITSPTSLPSPKNLPQKSVNSPPTMAYKTSVGKDLGANKSLVEQAAKANAKG
ncbi:hypothetical protein Bca4012_083925 [Brassica carinata]|uniref:Uncharacterized protein n=1 Tax=Brassica carinata TaxID=52824 RepID=A0A8X7SIG5_BRACI|nr:hypothetical protein Bca52824_026854 [Brassica carinata]